jgi:MFS family permease
VSTSSPRTVRSSQLADGQSRAGTWRALHHYNYRLYFAGQIISQSGTWLQRLAQSWLVLELTDSPAALGILAVFQFLPAMLLSLVAGVVADRVQKRRLIMVTSSLAAIQALTLAALVLTGHIQLWQVDVLAMTLGIITTFETPARQAFVSELVPPEDLRSAVALNSSVFNAARVAGPGVGGLIVAAWGTGWAFALNGVSYLAVLAALLLLRPHLLRQGRAAARGALWSQLGDGLRHAAHDPRLAFPVSLLAVVGMLGYNFGVVLPLLARYTLDAGVAGFGTLNAAMGAGSLVGALLVTARISPSPWSVALSALGFSLSLLTVAFVPWYGTMLVVLALLGVLSVTYSTSTNTTLQLASGEAYRGRILSLYSLLFMGTTPIGGAVTGFLADRWGVQLALTIEALICLAATLIGMAYLRRLGSRTVATPSPLDEVSVGAPARS